MEFAVKRWLRLELASLIVLLLVSSYFYSVRASEMRFNITDGTYIRNTMPDTNFGTATQWTVSRPGYDAYIDLGNEYYGNATLYIYKTATNIGYMRIMSVDYFGEDDLTWNTREEFGAECVANHSFYEQGYHSYSIAGCGRYIALNATVSGAGNIYSDDYVGGNNPYVLYDSDYSGNFINFNPNVNETNSTNVSYNYYGSSNIFHYGSYRHSLRIRGHKSTGWQTYSELLYEYTANIDSYSTVSIQDWITNPLYNLTYDALEFRVNLSDAVSVIDTDTIIYNMSYIESNTTIPEVPPALTYPAYTPYPYPTYDPGADLNDSVNVSSMADWINYSSNSMGKINSSVNGVFGFVTFPITSLRSGIQYVNMTFVAMNNSKSLQFLTIVCPCLISSIHWKVKAVMSLGLLFGIILIIMGRR